MKNIGKYQGTSCFQCTKDELDDLLRKGKDDDKKIYIANGVMVKNGIIIGYYDGMYVKEDYSGTRYFVATAPKEEKESEVFYSKKKSKWDETATAVSNVSYEDLVKQDIDFGNYSKIVDEFFALLEV